MSPPRNLIGDSLLLFYFTIHEEKNILSIKQVLTASKLTKNIITKSQLYLNIALCLHCNYGDAPAVEQFIKLGADVNFNNGRPLRDACQSLNNDLIGYILNKHVDEKINIKIIQSLAYYEKYKHIKIYMNNRNISLSIINKLTKYMHIPASFELFDFLWNYINNLGYDRIIQNEYHNIESILIYFIHETLDVLIENDNIKLFEHLMRSSIYSEYIYKYPFIGRGLIQEEDEEDEEIEEDEEEEEVEEDDINSHFLAKIYDNELTSYIQYIDIKKIGLAILYRVINHSVYDHPGYIYFDIVLIKKFINSYDKNYYIHIIPKLLTTGDVSLIDSVVAAGYDVNDLILKAFKHRAYNSIKYLFSLGADRQVISNYIEKFFKEEMINRLNFYDWKQYIRGRRDIPDEITDVLVFNIIQHPYY